MKSDSLFANHILDNNHEFNPEANLKIYVLQIKGKYTFIIKKLRIQFFHTIVFSLLLEF